MRRYNCGCGKKRYRDEPSALAAADNDQETYGGVVTVYRCPGGLAWHLTSRGFTPGALRAAGRRLAWELLEHGEADHRGRAAELMTSLGLVERTDSGRLVALDRAGLVRVVQIGLDAFAAERG